MPFQIEHIIFNFVNAIAETSALRCSFEQAALSTKTC